MELNIEELNYMLNAVDTHIRANGIKGAGVAVMVASKLQEAAKSAGAPPIAPPPGDGETPIEE